MALTKLPGYVLDSSKDFVFANANVTGTATLAEVTLTGNIIPTSNNVFSLGDTEHVFKDVYIGPGSLYIDGSKVLEASGADIIVTADVNQNLRILTTGSGDIEFDPTGTGVISIKGPLQFEAGTQVTSSDGSGVPFADPVIVDSITSLTLNADLNIAGNGVGIVKINDDLTITGNLTIQGTTGNLSVTNLVVQDNIVDISAETVGTPSSNAGIRVIRGDEPSVQLRWNESTDKWQITNDGSNYLDIMAKDSSGNITANYFIGNGSQLTGLPSGYNDTNANSAIDARVTKTFIDNLQINANTLNGHSDTYFATSTQGNKADTAIQTGANISVFTNDSGYLVAANLSTYATQTYVGNAIADLVSSAPATLNTLNELANALGNDANFSATITNSIASKLSTTDFSSTANAWINTYTGNLSVSNANLGNTVTANYFVGNGSQLTGLPAGYTDSNVSSYLPSYTGNLSPSNLVVSNSVNLGLVSNITITGGTAGQVLSTDGSGNLSWETPAAGSGGSNITSATITIDSFTGNGVQTAFNLTVTPANTNQVAVNYNGTMLLRETYSLVNNVVTFGSAPANGSKLEITTTQLQASGSFTSRTYTGNGVQNTFAVTSGVTVSSLLVVENGVVQLPTTDYVVSGANLIFTTAPDNGVVIQIRELAIAIAENNTSASAFHPFFLLGM